MLADTKAFSLIAQKQEIDIINEVERTKNNYKETPMRSCVHELQTAKLVIDEIESNMKTESHFTKIVKYYSREKKFTANNIKVYNEVITK